MYALQIVGITPNCFFFMNDVNKQVTRNSHWFRGYVPPCTWYDMQHQFEWQYIAPADSAKWLLSGILVSVRVV